jgi:hypothetical protein
MLISASLPTTNSAREDESCMIDCCCGHVPTGELPSQQLPQVPALGWHLIAKSDEGWLLRRFDRGVQMYVLMKQYQCKKNPHSTYCLPTHQSSKHQMENMPVLKPGLAVFDPPPVTNVL